MDNRYWEVGIQMRRRTKNGERKEEEKTKKEKSYYCNTGDPKNRTHNFPSYIIIIICHI